MSNMANPSNGQAMGNACVVVGTWIEIVYGCDVVAAAETWNCDDKAGTWNELVEENAWRKENNISKQQTYHQ